MKGIRFAKAPIAAPTAAPINIFGLAATNSHIFVSRILPMLMTSPHDFRLVPQFVEPYDNFLGSPALVNRTMKSLFSRLAADQFSKAS